MDLSATSLEQAMINIAMAVDERGRLKPTPVSYELRVSHVARISAGKLLEELNLVNVGRTPFRIHVELSEDPAYQRYEWSVHANEEAFGSMGAA